MKHKLFLVEGLPCSGKSTISKYIAQLLKKQGNNVIWIDEGTGNHPADYEFQSYLSEELYRKLREDDKRKIMDASIRRCNGYIVELGQLEGKLLEYMMQFKIYDALAWDIEKEIMLDKWKMFVNQAKPNTIYVFNCCFMQNPMCETMMRFGYDLACSKDFITSIANIIAPMDPVCIYLQVNEIENKINQAVKERGDNWLNAVVEYHTLGEYGKKHNLSGFEGYISCLEERQRRELSIMNSLDMKRFVFKQANDYFKQTNRIMSKIMD